MVQHKYPGIKYEALLVFDNLFLLVFHKIDIKLGDYNEAIKAKSK